MPLPHLHLYLPARSIAAYLLEWLADVENALHGDANWDGCQFFREHYNLQAGFDVPTAVGNVRRNPGPVIFVQKVQTRPFNRFRDIVRRDVSVYRIFPSSAEDILAACEQARLAYEDGEPRIPLRELIAYLIIAKLARMDMWGGSALNKNFLWAHDLPHGGFPKDVVDNRSVMEVADHLCNTSVGVLNRKPSENEMKYALGPKSIIDPILELRHFESIPELRKYFERSKTYVSARLLNYNTDA
ncbi:MAG: hypothetical protein WD648_12790 [Planctomycetaceae bacterium]